VEVRRIILDTSAYSAFMRGHEGLTRALQEVDEIALNPIILGELRAGFLLGRGARTRTSWRASSPHPGFG
jgi:predicted nucleic acid-binding protein